MTNKQSELTFVDDFPVSANWFLELVPMLMARARYRDVAMSPDGRSATAMRDIQQSGAVVKRETVQIVVRWAEIADEYVRVEWGAFDYSMGQRGAPHGTAGIEFGESIRFTVYGTPQPDSIPLNLVLGPDQFFDGRFNGNLRDYSFCATAKEVAEFEVGELPLGVQGFEGKDGKVVYGKPLYLAGYRNGAPMLYNGVLVCAPQNSGKTQLVLRWAMAANRARYNIFLVDVKGNLYDKLMEQGWKGKIYRFDTNPVPEPASDRINFLAGYVEEPVGFTPATSDRIKQLVTALLPSEGYKGEGGKEEFYYRNRVIWLTALVHILLLKQIYQPWKFKDCRRVEEECLGNPCQASRDQCQSALCERTMDLGDLYELTASESLLYEVIADLRVAEERARKVPDIQMPECGVDYWVRELALLLSPQKISEGQRPVNDSYQLYTAGLKQALEPFAKHGTLHRKISDNGPGRLFRLEDLAADPPDEPVTILLAAREQDQINAETVLAMAITRLQHLLFDRMPLKKPRPILMLLDETRRIRGFEANRYITFAREAKAGCVIVYQSLDQIGDEKKIAEILENVGTQIYLGSLVGNSAKYFINILPKRYRATFVENVQRSSGGVTRTQILSHELVDCFTTNELYKLPCGEYPAMVYVCDQPRRKPFLVDMDEKILPPPTTVLKVELVGTHQAAVTGLVMWPGGTAVLSTDASQTLQAWRIPCGEVEAGAAPLIICAAASGGCAAVAPVGNMYATGTLDGRVCIFDNGSLVRTLEAHADAVRSVKFTCDGKWIVSGADDGTVVVHEPLSGDLIELLSVHTEAVVSVAVSEDGNRIAMASKDATARVFSLEDWKELNLLQTGGPVTAMACSANFDTIALAVQAGVGIWKPAEQSFELLERSRAAPLCVAESADAKVIVAGFEDSVVQVWAGPSRALTATVAVDSGAVTAVILCADHRNVIFASSDGQIRLLRLDPFFD